MARVKIILYKSKTYSDGRHPLMIQIIHNRKIKRISLNRELFLEEWDKESGLPKKGATNYNSITTKVIDMRAKVDKVLTELEREKPNYLMEDIVALLGKPSVHITCTGYINKLIDRFNTARRYGNARSYQCALSGLRSFAGKEDVLFSEIDYKFLNLWKEHHLGNGYTINGHNVYLRAIRAAFNKAINEEVISANIYPFNKYRIINEHTKKRAISKEEMKKIVNLDLIEGTDLWHSRNMFLFSFFTIGMSWVDIAHLKLANIVGNRIRYKRAKTGKEYNIRINEKIEPILEFYTNNKQQNSHIFPIIKRESDMDIILDIKNNLKNHNHRLRKIGKLVGISEHLTSYVARHSWASIANFSGVHIGVISQGLGHNDIKTTQTYLANFDFSDIDEANAGIL